MTLWISRDEQTITIHGNTGLDVSIRDSRVSEYAVTEHYKHLRVFWHSLGEELHRAEAIEAAQNAPAESPELPELPEDLD